MEKWKKVLRIVLTILGCAALVAIQVSVALLPRRFGVEWIFGWPEFLATSLSYGITFLGVYLILPKSLREKRLNPKPELTPAQVKKRTRIMYIVLAVILIGQSALASFVIQFRKIDRYEYSPNGKNKALVWVYKKDEDFSAICPVRAWFFYEDNNDVYLHPKYEDITFTWLDDNTLEIIKTWKDSGEVETGCLRW